MGLADSLGWGKTASFQATVTVHELLQVPLLNAKFRIKWKFKGATHSLVQAGDDASSGAHQHHRHAHGFAERFLHPRSALSSNSSATATPPAPIPASNGTDRERTPTGTRARSRSPYAVYSSEDGEDVRSPTQSPPLSPESRTPNPNRAGSSAFTFPSPGGDAKTLYATPSNRTGTYDSGKTATSPDGPDGTGAPRRRGASDLSALASTGSGAPASAHRPEPKGSTTFVPLRAHTAVFSREITCPVQVSLRHVAGSSKYQLQPCPVRLSVKQEVPGEDGKPEEERLGEIVLDLSQFATHPHKGGAADDVRPRRYLLQDCKSNAVLRVSVKMQWIDGEKHFVAPPFRTGQLATNSSAAKGLDSGRNSPAARSSASIAHKANSTTSSTSSPTRLSGSNYARSTTSTTSVNRSNSTSSAGSVPGTPSPLSAASSLAPSVRNGHSSQHAHHHRPPRKPRKVWHPSSVLALSPSGAGLPADPTSTHTAGSGRVPDRSAADIVEGLFNRPLRRMGTDGTVTGAAGGGGGGGDDDPLARDMLDGGGQRLGEPIELRQGCGGGLSGGWRAHKARRSAARSSAPAAGAGVGHASKAWSICSNAKDKGKDKDTLARDRDRDVALHDASLPGGGGLGPQTDQGGRSPQDDVPQPTPATYAKTEAPAEAQRKRERAKWFKDVTHSHAQGHGDGGHGHRHEHGHGEQHGHVHVHAHGPVSSHHHHRTSDKHRSGHPHEHPHPHPRALPPLDVHVQPPTPKLPLERTMSSPAAATGGPATGAPHLAPQQQRSPSSSSSSTLSGMAQPLSVRWGDRSSSASTSTSPTTPTPLSASRSSSSTDLAPGPAPARPTSSASFHSLVTPPSPERRPHSAGSGRKDEPLASRTRGRDKPGERAPNGEEWGRSWG